MKKHLAISIFLVVAMASWVRCNQRRHTYCYDHPVVRGAEHLLRWPSMWYRCIQPSPYTGNGRWNCWRKHWQSGEPFTCAVDGGWSPWGAWCPWSATCDAATRTRHRTCTNPSPAHDGADCAGSETDAESRNNPPCPALHPCCEPGELRIDTNNGSTSTSGSLPGASIESGPSNQVSGSHAGKVCSDVALIKVTFDTITDTPCDICVENPYCGRRMLKIDFELSPGERSDYLFNIGDSISNNGFAGDNSDQQNDAELEGVDADVRLYLSDKGGSVLANSYAGIIGSDSNHMTAYISNEFIRLQNSELADVGGCVTNSFALNGQSDSSQGSVNQDIYISINRVILQSSDRVGVGICHTTLSWACPWH